MMAGIPGIRAGGGSQKGERGDAGPKGIPNITFFKLINL